MCLSSGGSGAGIGKGGAGLLLIVGGVAEGLRGSGDDVSNVLPDKVGLVDHIGLVITHVLRIEVFIGGQFIGVIDDILLVGSGGVDVGDGFADDFLGIALGGEDAGDGAHGVAGIALLVAGVFNRKLLDALHGAGKGGI